jgi:hypothetical protein
LAAATHAVRGNDGVLAESVMWDKTPLGLRLRRALKVLCKHGQRTVRDITLPNGKWLDFKDLSIPRSAQGWSRQDYAALCNTIGATRPESQRKWDAKEQGRGQTTLMPVQQAPAVKLTDVAQGGQTFRPRSIVDKFRRIRGVSDPHPEADCYLCHFNTPKHAKELHFPEQWRDDWELASYLVKAAAVLTVRCGTPPQKCGMTCAEAFRAATGEVHITMRSKHGEDDVAMAVTGHRGIRAYMPAQAMQAVATRPSERVFKNDCTPSQWAIVKKHQLNLQRAVARQREGTEIEHACVGSGGAGRGATITRQGQQSLHAYGQTRHKQSFPTCGRIRAVQPQSEEK